MAHRVPRMMFMCLAFAACSKTPSTVQASATTAGSAITSATPSAPEPSPVSDAPWSIQFSLIGPSTLKNGTGRTYRVLHDRFIQPSRLEVRDAQGTLVPAFDQRTRMKFNTVPRREAFVEMANGAELGLFELRTLGGDDQYALEWGPYRIGPLKAGVYHVNLVFEASRDRAFDEDKGKDVTVEDAFVGTVRSEPVPVRLPLRTR